MDSKEVISQLDKLMKEAIELRGSSPLPKRTDASETILDRLYTVRQALDRLEEIMRTVNRMRHLADRQRASFVAVADDQWANNLSKIRQLPTFRSDNMVGPRERYAEADLSTMEHKRSARQAEELLSHVDEADRFVRTCYYGLNGVREDIKELIRTLFRESSIER